MFAMKVIGYTLLEFFGIVSFLWESCLKIIPKSLSLSRKHLPKVCHFSSIWATIKKIMGPLLSIEILIVQWQDPYFIVYETVPEYIYTYIYIRTYIYRERNIAGQYNLL